MPLDSHRLQIWPACLWVLITSILDGIPRVSGPCLRKYPVVFDARLRWPWRYIPFICRCVFTAVLGMASVVWYSLGGHFSDQEVEQEVRAKIEAKAKRGRFFGLIPRHNQWIDSFEKTQALTLMHVGIAKRKSQWGIVYYTFWCDLF